MINLKEEAVYKLSLYKGKIEGELEICSSSIPSQYILPYIIKDFKALYPDVCFKIKQTDSKIVLDKIKEGYSDFGVIGFDCKSKNIECTKLMGDNLVLALPKLYKDRYIPYDNISLEELLTIPIILREEGSGSRYMVEAELLKQGILIDRLNITGEANNNNTIKRLIRLSLGGSFMSYLAVKEEIKRGEIIPVNIAGMDLKRNFYLICHKKRFLSPLSNAFKEFVLRNGHNLDKPSEL